MKTINLFWFRRDLRINDNIGLIHASRSGNPILPIFIFDRNILSQLEDIADKRVDYIHQALTQLNIELTDFGGGITSFFDTPINVFKQLIADYNIEKVFFNRDYEPYARERDDLIIEFLKAQGIKVEHFKDQVIFESHEIIKTDSTPYTVYTPYSKQWKLKYLSSKNDTHCIDTFTCIPPQKPLHSLDEIGFVKTEIKYEKPHIDTNLLEGYELNRNFPSKDATTRLGVALRFGTISIRKCVFEANKHSAIWLNELIWREFFMQILYHFPSVVNHSFKTKYDFLEWRNNEIEFDKWCKGETGYLMVDAGMKELNSTGFMHNRVRMVVASFLTKHLLIDWRWGEAYFASKLLDYELSSNNGNWQWAAGTGCDAAPYFRIFNPTEQLKKFDHDLTYVSKWIPDIADHLSRFSPIVNHEEARKRALNTYKKLLN